MVREAILAHDAVLAKRPGCGWGRFGVAASDVPYRVSRPRCQAVNFGVGGSHAQTMFTLRDSSLFNISGAGAVDRELCVYRPPLRRPLNFLWAPLGHSGSPLSSPLSDF